MAKRCQEVKQKFFEAINQNDVALDDQGGVASHGNTFFAWTSRIPGQPLRSWG